MMAYVTNCVVTNISGKAANYLQVVTKKENVDGLTVL
jgi:hypothetical protein